MQHPIHTTPDPLESYPTGADMRDIVRPAISDSASNAVLWLNGVASCSLSRW